MTALLAALLVAQAQPTSADLAAAIQAAQQAAQAAQKAAEAAQAAAERIAATPAAPAAAAPAPAAAPVVTTGAAAAAIPVWAGTVSLGFIALTGNSSTITFATSAQLQRKTADYILGIKAGGAYGQTHNTSTDTDQVTALNATLQARADWRFSPTVSTYLLGGVDTDHLKSIEARPYGELGVSFQWWDVKEGDFLKSSLRTDLGFRYGRELRYQYYPTRAQLPDVDIVAPTAGAQLRYALSKDVIFTDDVAVVGNLVGEARLLLTNTAKLSSKLTDKVALGIGFVVASDSVPPPGKVSTDTALTVGLDVGI